jgi:cytochrome b
MPTTRTARWDPLVRLTHWGVAAGVVANGVLTEEGSNAHLWVGYGVGGLLLLRWLWGLIGAENARFTAFPPSPRRAAAHVRDIARGRKTAHGSHNPLGALMVYALWITLAVVIGTGVAMTGLPGAPVQAEASLDVPRSAPHEEDDDGRTRASAGREEAEVGRETRDGEPEGGGEMLEEVHEVAANLLFVLAAIHLLGVAFETRRRGRGVVSAMVTGGRPRPAE